MILPLVSVIVPIYNQEQYLEKCVRSILNQTYEKLQIILVNDGSTDRSLELCLNFAEKDKRCHIINKENGGLSSARNAGLDIATGEYVTFVDSDDYLEPEAVQQMIFGAMEQLVDIVCMNWCSVSYDYMEKDKSNFIKKEFLGITITGKDYLKGVCKRKFSDSVWAKLFRYEIIKKYKFSLGKLNEDFLFLSEILMKQQAKVGFIEYYGYCYYEREGSISRSGLGKSSIDAVNNALDMQKLAAIEEPELEKYYGAYALYQARTTLILMSREGCEKYKDVEKICIGVMKENLHYVSGSFMSVKDKLFCFGLAYMPKTVMKIIGKVE